jgi:AraC-like DNA-binding protein
VVFIPQNCQAVFEVLKPVKVLQLDFNNQLDLYESMGWEELKGYSTERDIFHKLEILPRMESVINSIMYYRRLGIDSPAMDTVKEKELFFVFNMFYSKQSLTRFIKPLLRQDIEFQALVMKYCDEVKTVEDLAARFDMSARSFTRRFAAQFHDSPYQWLLKHKANCIRTLLADKTMPMQSIIKKYGFSSPSHFTTYCKKQFGVTPSSYRKRLNGAIEA